MWQQTWKEDEEDDDVEKENQWGVFSLLLAWSKFKTRLFFHYYSNVFEELKKKRIRSFLSFFFLYFFLKKKRKKKQKKIKGKNKEGMYIYIYTIKTADSPSSKIDKKVYPKEGK